MEFPKEGDSNRSNGGLSNNLTEFKQALKSGIERMETVLQETESTASNEAQQYEELRQRAEVKVGLLGAQLQEMEGREPHLQDPRAGAPTHRKRKALKPSRETQLRDYNSQV
jgi:uncharacterized phage infection (PIP) family protein YhgE